MLIVDPIGGVWVVDIWSLAGGVPTSISVSMPVPTPPGPWPLPGVAFSLDVDESTGDIYVLHEDTLGGGNMTVTIIPY